MKQIVCCIFFVCFTAAAFVAHGADVPRDGLFLEYVFNAEAEDIIFDTSGSGHNAVPSNPSYTADRDYTETGSRAFAFVQGATLDSSQVELTFPLTISFWIASFQSAPGPGTIIDWREHTKPFGGVLMEVEVGGNISVQAGTEAQAKYDSVLKVSSGDWSHVAVVFHSDSSFEFYIDGKSDSVNATAGDLGNNQALFFGNRWQPDPFARFDGWLDDVRFYSRALSPIEISALAQAGAEPEFPLTPEFQLNEPEKAPIRLSKVDNGTKFTINVPLYSNYLHYDAWFGLQYPDNELTFLNTNKFFTLSMEAFTVNKQICQETFIMYLPKGDYRVLYMIAPTTNGNFYDINLGEGHILGQYDYVVK